MTCLPSRTAISNSSCARSEEAKTHLLPSDRALLLDRECAGYVETYALNQDTFFKDFAAASTSK